MEFSQLTTGGWVTPPEPTGWSYNSWSGAVTTASPSYSHDATAVVRVRVSRFEGDAGRYGVWLKVTRVSGRGWARRFGASAHGRQCPECHLEMLAESAAFDLHLDDVAGSVAAECTDDVVGGLDRPSRDLDE